MDNLKEALAELQIAIDTVDTPQEALNLMDDMYELERGLRSLRTMLPESIPEDLRYALDDDLENFEALACDLMKEAKNAALDLQDEIDDIAKFGSYREQHR